MQDLRLKLNSRLTNDCSGVIPLYVPCLKCMTLAYLYDTNIHNKKSTHTYLVLNQTHNFSLTIRGGQLVELLYKRSSKESNLKQVCSDLEVVKLCENGWYLFKILMITMLSNSIDRLCVFIYNLYWFSWKLQGFLKLLM